MAKSEGLDNLTIYHFFDFFQNTLFPLMDRYL